MSQKLKIWGKKARAANKRHVAFLAKIATRWVYFIHFLDNFWYQIYQRRWFISFTTDSVGKIRVIFTVNQVIDSSPSQNGHLDRSLHGYCWQEEDYCDKRAGQLHIYHTTHFRGGREDIHIQDYLVPAGVSSQN